MSEINEIKEPTSEVNEHLSCEELIERYATIQQISIDRRTWNLYNWTRKSQEISTK